MQKTQTKQDGAPEALPAEKKESSQAPAVSRGASRESFWGAVLFAGMLLFVAASVCGVGWVAYKKWQSERVARNQPSIAVLSEQSGGEKSALPAEPAPVAGSAETEQPLAGDSALAAKKLEISVLNGGAARGSAGILAAFLKQEGYSKTDSGNALKDYFGVSVNYASGLEKEAAAIKESVAKKYPQVTILPADTQNKETTASQVTVILGK